MWCANSSPFAVAAMKKLQGYELEGQQIRVQYAKSKSHAVAKVEGTYAVRHPDYKSCSASFSHHFLLGLDLCCVHFFKKLRLHETD